MHLVMLFLEFKETIEMALFVPPSPFGWQLLLRRDDDEDVDDDDEMMDETINKMIMQIYNQRINA